MSKPSFNKDAIREFLANYGYTANPAGLVEFYSHDYAIENEMAYLDINAEAVRKGSEVPDRPIRLKFEKVSFGPSSRWELRSVEELGSGVESKALDRDPHTPKVSPWPNTRTKHKDVAD
jgi:hypothetical protein